MCHAAILCINGRFIFSSGFFFFFTLLSKICNLFANMKNQNANYHDPLYLTATLSRPDPPASSRLLSLLQPNCMGRQWVISASHKKRGNRIPHPFLKPLKALRQNIIFQPNISLEFGRWHLPPCYMLPYTNNKFLINSKHAILNCSTKKKVSESYMKFI